jgi:hypothetical protein
MIQFICMQLSKEERENIGSTWSMNTFLDSLLATAQNLVVKGLEDYQSSQSLNSNDQK